MLHTYTHTYTKTYFTSTSNFMALLSRPSSDLAEFRKLLAAAKRVVVLTGAGVSAESGVPTFRGAGGFWRTYQVRPLVDIRSNAFCKAQDLATPGAFDRDPSLVWEFYHYRREVRGIDGVPTVLLTYI